MLKNRISCEVVGVSRRSEDESAQAKLPWTLPAKPVAKSLPAQPVASAKPEGHSLDFEEETYELTRNFFHLQLLFHPTFLPFFIDKFSLLGLGRFSLLYEQI